jgi:hypothetical protein
LTARGSILPLSQSNDRFAPLVARLREAVLDMPGALSPAVRRAIERRATSHAGHPDVPGELSPELASYVDKVSVHSYQVTDRDIQELTEAGYSDGEIFEATVAASVGAAVGRLERGLGAMRAGR